jgi:hypothetical protein
MCPVLYGMLPYGVRVFAVADEAFLVSPGAKWCEKPNSR